MIHAVDRDWFGDLAEPPLPPRTDSAQIGQLSVNGPIGLYPQLGHDLATVSLGG